MRLVAFGTDLTSASSFMASPLSKGRMVIETKLFAPLFLACSKTRVNAAFSTSSACTPPGFCAVGDGAGVGEPYGAGEAPPAGVPPPPVGAGPGVGAGRGQ